MIKHIVIKISDKYVKICASKDWALLISVHSFFTHVECYNISKSLNKEVMIILVFTFHIEIQQASFASLQEVNFLIMFLSTAVTRSARYLMEYGS